MCVMSRMSLKNIQDILLALYISEVGASLKTSRIIIIIIGTHLGRMHDSLPCLYFFHTSSSSMRLLDDSIACCPGI